MIDRISVSSRSLTAIIIAVLLALVTWVLADVLSYHAELGRRHHQIGQLWTFCLIYYLPEHGGHFPHDLEELKHVPKYAGSPAYWDRAISEIEIIAPGAGSNDADPGHVVVFREKKADQHGIRAFHEVGGDYGFVEESGTTASQVLPWMIGG